MSLAGSQRERVGSYRLIHLIRKSQVCELWEVERRAGEPRLAMKLLPVGENHTREQVHLMRHEFHVGRNLKHPSVIETFELNSGSEGTYLVMELFRHPNLKQWIQQEGNAVETILETVITNMAKGLEYLHQQGWIHRDVKPDNFLCSSEGEVKLIDFNIAMKKRGKLAQVFLRKTKVQGTQSYMSPEQIRGNNVDERSDIYSLGCVLHELVSGKLPFTGTSSQELLTKHLKSRPPKLSESEHGVTSEFASQVKRMMAKKPTSRPQSLGEVVQQLTRTRIFSQNTRPAGT